ncbi:MAG: hypothetical protein NXH75_17425 [Halobacteriovoraceae bacterium]|jgi:uncharacterized protein YacL (UPF0231 family)|nr:hypothetical protein [Halobacteriovoraceae bacterium]
MLKATKLYSNVMKVTVLACLLASTSICARPLTENQKMVLGNLRLSLWYQGLEISQNFQNSNNRKSVEELDRAIMRYDNESLSLSSITPKGSTKGQKQL